MQSKNLDPQFSNGNKNLKTLKHAHIASPLLAPSQAHMTATYVDQLISAIFPVIFLLRATNF